MSDVRLDVRVGESLVDRLNRECRCTTLDLEALHHELESAAGTHGLYETLTRSHPHLFSASPVFVAPEDIERMQAVIRAVERVVALPGYRAHVLARSPAIAAFDPAARGVFLGFDFHLGAAGPQLIEINTNAGGALLCTVLARAQQTCCEELQRLVAQPGLERAILEMFKTEWCRQRGDTQLRSVAIVDDAPETQYLQPEFLLFRRLFEVNGIAAVIADPQSLSFRNGALWHEGRRIDLVYNRLTDFFLAAPEHRTLKEAYLDNAVVVTPHPRAYALYADKRDLAVLTDAALLRSFGADETDIATLLNGVPRTRTVEPSQAEALWAERKRVFFKPAAGFGSKAAYRGDKITKAVFARILAGDYVAQTLVAPSERGVRVAGRPATLKMDLRNYVYDGQVQLLAARLYQGQTTNFRTEGGGFAPVFSTPAMPGMQNK